MRGGVTDGSLATSVGEYLDSGGRSVGRRSSIPTLSSPSPSARFCLCFLRLCQKGAGLVWLLVLGMRLPAHGRRRWCQWWSPGRKSTWREGGEGNRGDGGSRPLGQVRRSGNGQVCGCRGRQPACLTVAVVGRLVGRSLFGDLHIAFVVWNLRQREGAKWRRRRRRRRRGTCDATPCGGGGRGR